MILAGQRGQHHARLAWMVVAGLCLASAAGFGAFAFPQPGGLWHAIAGPDIDGSWRVIWIDGLDVRRDGYSLGIRWGKITGFNNGCNSCGFDDDLPSGSPNRSMMCTLVACTDRPNDPLFAPFAFGNPEIVLDGERLILRVEDRRAVLERAD